MGTLLWRTYDLTFGLVLRAPGINCERETRHALQLAGATADYVHVKRLIEQQRPDLVHLHSRRGADILGGIAARMAGVRSVLSRRVDNPESPRVVKWKYRLYDRVITISQGIADVLLSEGLPAEKLVCARSAVLAEDYQAPCNRPW